MNSESYSIDWKRLLRVLVHIALAAAIVGLYLGSSTGSSSCSYSGVVTTGGVVPVETNCARPLWIDVIFSWPFTAAGLALILGGLAWRQALPLYLSAFFSVPWHLYAAGAPITFFIPLAFPFLLVVSAQIIRKHTSAARLLALPAIVIMTLAWVIVIVSNSA